MFCALVRDGDETASETQHIREEKKVLKIKYALVHLLLRPFHRLLSPISILHLNNLPLLCQPPLNINLPLDHNAKNQNPSNDARSH